VAAPPTELEHVPVLDWLNEPTPLLSLPEVACELGLESLEVKRDDLLGALHGGSKVRKLAYLLAQPAFESSKRWLAIGAIGSGHLSTVAAAAEALGHELEVLTFWQEPTPWVLENLAHTASTAARLAYHSTRLRMGLAHPLTVLAGRNRGAAVVPPGGTSPAGMLGMLRAGLELVGQFTEGGRLPPDEVVVPLGSGGCAVGLARGLAVAGVPTRVRAVAAVERVFVTRRRLRRLDAQLCDWLRAIGLPELARQDSAPLTIDRGQVGRHYGTPTGASLAACERIAREGLRLEPTYGGRAMAALLAVPRRGERVVFWLTSRQAARPPCDPAWRDRLPARLAARLDGPRKRLITRRRLLLGGAALACAATLRLTGYPERPGWSGRVLSAREASIVDALVEALLAPAPLGSAAYEVPDRVDDYLVGLPPRTQRDVHAALFAIEHGTTPLDFRWSRLTSLEPAERTEYLDTLAARGGLQATLYRGVRDLCMLGYYQHPDTWPDLGYALPSLAERVDPEAYDALRAEPDQMPRCLRRAA